MKFIIDRFEGDNAVVETMDGQIYDIPVAFVQDAQEGDVLKIEILKKETITRQKHLKKLMNQVFENELPKNAKKAP